MRFWLWQLAAYVGYVVLFSVLLVLGFLIYDANNPVLYGVAFLFGIFVAVYLAIKAAKK